jgi:hypothetical protein
VRSQRRMPSLKAHTPCDALWKVLRNARELRTPDTAYRIERLLSSIALPAVRAVTKFGPVGRTSPWAGKSP